VEESRAGLDGHTGGPGLVWSRGVGVGVGVGVWVVGLIVVQVMEVVLLQLRGEVELGVAVSGVGH